MKSKFLTVVFFAIALIGCVSGTRFAAPGDVAGELSDHIIRLFASIPDAPPENLQSKEGQTYMQMLPAVGREDIHAEQTTWPMRSQVCAIAESTKPLMDAIADAARNTNVVIINEAHDRPRHREFIRQVIVVLQPLGYSNFAAETFSDSLKSSEQPAYPLMTYGHYSNEPVFGSLLRTLASREFNLLPYEHRFDNSGAELDVHERVSLREEGQANNLLRVLQNR